MREVNLVAQDSTSWGKDLPGRPRLAELVRALDDVPGIDWIRLLYLYPSAVDDELIEAIGRRASACSPTWTCRSSTRATECCGRCGGAPRRRASAPRRAAARRDPGPHAPHHLHRRLSGRDRGRLRGALRLRARDALRSRGRVPLLGRGGDRGRRARRQGAARRRARPLPRAWRASSARSWPRRCARRSGSRATSSSTRCSGRGRALGRFASQAPEIDGVTLPDGEGRARARRPAARAGHAACAEASTSRPNPPARSGRALARGAGSDLAPASDEGEPRHPEAHQHERRRLGDQRGPGEQRRRDAGSRCRGRGRYRPRRPRRPERHSRPCPRRRRGRSRQAGRCLRLGPRSASRTLLPRGERSPPRHPANPAASVALPAPANLPLPADSSPGPVP